jgi:DNA-binding response OmpR family regulator
MDVFITRLRKYLAGDTGVEILSVSGKGLKLVVSRE